MLERYGRQIAYKNIGEQGQIKLSRSSIAVVGLGGLGSNAASLLARAGVGKLELIDGDKVELTNLQRQTLFFESDIGKPKVEAAKAHLQNINSDLESSGHAENVSEDNIAGLLADCDLVLDCTDDISARFTINRFCVAQRKTWVHAAVAGDFGYVKTFLRGQTCYACYTHPEAEDASMANEGVLNTLVAAIAGLQVTQAIKVLLGQDVCEELLYFNVWKPELRFINIKKNNTCTVCGS